MSDITSTAASKITGAFRFHTFPYTCAMFEAHVEGTPQQTIQAFESYVLHKEFLYVRFGIDTPYVTNGLFSLTIPSGTNKYYSASARQKYSEIVEHFEKRCDVLLKQEGLPNIRATQKTYQSGGEHTLYIFRMPEFDSNITVEEDDDDDD